MSVDRKLLSVDERMRVPDESFGQSESDHSQTAIASRHDSHKLDYEEMASMTLSTRIDDILELRRNLAQKIESVTEKIESLSTAIRHLENQRDQLISQVGDESIVSKLKQIDFSKIQENIAEQLQALLKLKIRFSRPTLNIGVVGRARQGKSRLLQSLTGLSTEEIPDGDRQPCTGVRSTIHHNPNGDTYGEVWFHTERSFLDDVIAPYYKQLNLVGKPLALDEFASESLPQLPENISGSATMGAMYEHLRRYHTNIKQYRHLLRESSPRIIKKSQIREYVAQDTADGQRNLFNYLAVKEVKIYCAFPKTDVGKIAVVDMPGLGDTGCGDQENLIKALGQDIDFILFVRMPKTSGDFWADVDVQLYDTVRSSLKDLPIELWSFMVLNQTGENNKNCRDFLNTVTEKHLNFNPNLIEIANCTDPQQANELVLNRILDYLDKNMTALDKQYASSCQERIIDDIHKLLNAEIDKASQAFEVQIGDENFSQFLHLFDALWKDLTNGLEKLLEEFRKKRKQVDQNFQEEINATIKACNDEREKILPTKENIESRAREVKGYGTTYEQYLNEIRAHLSKNFLSLDKGLKRSLDNLKSQVADVLIEKGRVGSLTEARGEDFIKAMAEIIPEKLSPENPSQLKFGFNLLAEYELSYRGFLQHRIRDSLNKLTPNDEEQIKLSDTPNAEQIFQSLNAAYRESVYQCKNELEKCLFEPSQAAFAIVEEFLDRILRSEGIKNEWLVFMKNVSSEIWPEFKELKNRSKMGMEWQKSVEKVISLNQLSDLQFLT